MDYMYRSGGREIYSSEFGTGHLLGASSGVAKAVKTPEEKAATVSHLIHF